MRQQLTWAYENSNWLTTVTSGCFVLSCLAKTGQLERWLGQRRTAPDRRGLGTTQDHVAYLSETGDDTCCTQHIADTELMAKRAPVAIHGFQAAMLQQPCCGLLRRRN